MTMSDVQKALESIVHGGSDTRKKALATIRAYISKQDADAAKWKREVAQLEAEKQMLTLQLVGATAPTPIIYWTSGCDYNE